MIVNIEHLLDCAAIDSLTHQETIQLCDHIKSQAAEIERLRMALTELANAVGGLSPGDEPNVYADYDELHRLLSQARAALSGEPT